MTAPAAMPTCQRCQGEMWVCENHMDRPWNDKPGGCMCGAGAPCPDCNRDDPPKLPPGTKTEMDKDGWRH